MSNESDEFIYNSPRAQQSQRVNTDRTILSDCYGGPQTNVTTAETRNTIHSEENSAEYRVGIYSAHAANQMKNQATYPIQDAPAQQFHPPPSPYTPHAGQPASVPVTYLQQSPHNGSNNNVNTNNINSHLQMAPSSTAAGGAQRSAFVVGGGAGYGVVNKPDDAGGSAHGEMVIQSSPARSAPQMMPIQQSISAQNTSFQIQQRIGTGTSKNAINMRMQHRQQLMQAAQQKPEELAQYVATPQSPHIAATQQIPPHQHHQQQQSSYAVSSQTTQQQQNQVYVAANNIAAAGSANIANNGDGFQQPATPDGFNRNMRFAKEYNHTENAWPPNASTHSIVQDYSQAPANHHHQQQQQQRCPPQYQHVTQQQQQQQLPSQNPQHIHQQHTSQSQHARQQQHAVYRGHPQQQQQLPQQQQLCVQPQQQQQQQQGLIDENGTAVFYAESGDNCVSQQTLCRTETHETLAAAHPHSQAFSAPAVRRQIVQQQATDGSTTPSQIQSIVVQQQQQATYEDSSQHSQQTMMRVMDTSPTRAYVGGLPQQQQQQQRIYVHQQFSQQQQQQHPHQPQQQQQVFVNNSNQSSNQLSQVGVVRQQIIHSAQQSHPQIVRVAIPFASQQQQQQQQQQTPQQPQPQQQQLQPQSLPNSGGASVYVGSQRFYSNCIAAAQQQQQNPQQAFPIDNNSPGTSNPKNMYRDLKRKFKYLVYENEYYQEELRNLQQKLLKLSRDKNYLLDRLQNFEPLSDSSDDSDSSVKTIEDRSQKPKKRTPASNRSAAAMPMNGNGRRRTTAGLSTNTTPITSNVSYRHTINDMAVSKKSEHAHASPEQNGALNSEAPLQIYTSSAAPLPCDNENINDVSRHNAATYYGVRSCAAANNKDEFLAPKSEYLSSINSGAGSSTANIRTVANRHHNNTQQNPAYQQQQNPVYQQRLPASFQSSPALQQRRRNRMHSGSSSTILAVSSAAGTINGKNDNAGTYSSMAPPSSSSSSSFTIISSTENGLTDTTDAPTIFVSCAAPSSSVASTSFEKETLSSGTNGGEPTRFNKASDRSSNASPRGSAPNNNSSGSMTPKNTTDFKNSRNLATAFQLEYNNSNSMTEKNTTNSKSQDTISNDSLQTS